MVAEGFKNTEIGLIPNDWDVKLISEISTPVRGGSPRPAGSSLFFNGDYIPWLTVASLTNISQSKIMVTHTETKLTELGSQFSRRLERGTVIISNSGATLGVAKILAIDCCANDGIAALLNLEADKKYLTYYINTLTDHLRNNIATGNGQPNLNTGLIGNIPIPFPPLPEQKAIAEALSDADAWIANLEQLIAKKRLIKQGAMQQLLSPKEDWEVKKLGEVGFFIPTNSFSRDALNYSHGSVYNIHYGDIHTKFRSHFNVCRESVPFINQNILNNKQITACKEGDLIIADASENETDIGKAIEICFLNDLKVVSGLHTIHFRPLENRFRIGFLGFVFQSLVVHEQILKEAQGTKVLGISTSRIKEVAMSVPPLTEQNRITTILSDMDNEIESLENQLAKSTQIKQGMMQELLTGRVRLV